MASPDSHTCTHPKFTLEQPSPTRHPPPKKKHHSPEEKIEEWKSEVPMDRPGQPAEVAPSYVFLASEVGHGVWMSHGGDIGGQVSQGELPRGG